MRCVTDLVVQSSFLSRITEQWQLLLADAALLLIGDLFMRINDLRI